MELLILCSQVISFLSKIKKPAMIADYVSKDATSGPDLLRNLNSCIDPIGVRVAVCASLHARIELSRWSAVREAVTRNLSTP